MEALQICQPKHCQNSRVFSTGRKRAQGRALFIVSALFGAVSCWSFQPALADSESGGFVLGGSESGGFNWGMGSSMTGGFRSVGGDDSESGGVLWGTQSSSLTGGAQDTGADSDSGGVASAGGASEAGGPNVPDATTSGSPHINVKQTVKDYKW